MAVSVGPFKFIMRAAVLSIHENKNSLKLSSNMHKSYKRADL